MLGYDFPFSGDAEQMLVADALRGLGHAEKRRLEERVDDDSRWYFPVLDILRERFSSVGQIKALYSANNLISYTVYMFDFVDSVRNEEECWGIIPDGVNCSDAIELGAYIGPFCDTILRVKIPRELEFLSENFSAEWEKIKNEWNKNIKNTAFRCRRMEEIPIDTDLEFYSIMRTLNCSIQILHFEGRKDRELWELISAIQDLGPGLLKKNSWAKTDLMRVRNQRIAVGARVGEEWSLNDTDRVVARFRDALVRYGSL